MTGKKVNVVVSDVVKKDLRIIGFLAFSWAIGLIAIFLTGDERLLGLIPISNYVTYRITEELKKEGYQEALKK